MLLNVNAWESDIEKPTDSDIEEVERILKIKLPSSYVQLMKKWNGGYFLSEHQVLIKGNVPKKLNYYLGVGFWSLGALSGISTGMANTDSIVYTAKIAHEWGIPEKVIAFDGDGHTWLAFDYRDSCLSEPKIIFIESDDLLFFDIADNFTEFLKLLIPSDQVYDYDGNIIYKR